MTSQDFINLENQYGANNYKPMNVVLSKGRGVWVWDVDGKKYLDCLSAYSAVNQGHCHPKILKSMEEQARLLTIVSRAFRTDQLGLFYRELCEMTNSHRVLPMNSGAEAVETAIKTVRKWGHMIKNVPVNEGEIIVCANNFHGRTITVISFSTDENSRNMFGPFTPGFTVIPHGDAKALEAAITPKTIAFLVEPIQGEAGVRIPPDGYLKKVRDICTKNNVALILDEIQTGLGRTGKMLAEEHDGIESDLTVIGKALSGGFYPVSAVLSNNEVMDVFNPGEHGSTFGGNPLACAIARMALKVLVEENMVENSAVQGAYLLENLKKISNKMIKEIRGKGLMIGIEFHPEAGGAHQYCEKLKSLGILCKETHNHIIRIAPPLIIDRDTVDWALERFVKVLSE